MSDEERIAAALAKVAEAKSLLADAERYLQPADAADDGGYEQVQS